MTFAMISLLLSLFVTRKRNVYASGIGLVLLLYFISFFVELNDKLRFLGYLTPFKYANAADIVTRQSMRTGDLLILLGVIGLTVLAVFLIYRRKNIAI
jgi:ABC-2 type transport system permease protein